MYARDVAASSGVRVVVSAYGNDSISGFGDVRAFAIGDDAVQLRTLDPRRG